MWPMESLASKDEPPLVFVIPPFRIRRVIPRVAIALFLGLGAYIPLKIGISRTAEGLALHPELWLLFSILLAGIAFFLRLALPPRTSLARIEIWRDRLRLTPDRVQRIMGDPTIERTISPHSKEVLLRHGSEGGLRFGSSIVIRDENGAEDELKSICLNSLDQQASIRLANAISTQTGLPVCLAVRLRTGSGGFQDVPWTPVSRSAKMLSFAGLASAAPLAICGGAVVGHFSLPRAIEFAVGLALLGGWMFTLFLLSRTGLRRKKFPLLYSLTTVFTFSALYWFSVVAVEFLFS
jgi:hypothetical protein